ncbi:MAG: hypothetical protein ACRENU_11815 [Gemmatimonadaceae bacterium]
MDQTELELDFDVREFDPDWEAVARMFAEQLARTAEFDEMLERLERDASCKLRAADETEDFSDDWVLPCAAATLLREALDAHPDWEDLRSNERVLRDLRAARRAEAEGEHEDPVETVLISPRRRQNVIERIVLTQGGRVSGEYMHETGWRRHRVDLRAILSGIPLPVAIADAISRSRGTRDAMPTEELLAQLRAFDPHCNVSGPTNGAHGGATAVPYQYTKLPDVATASLRITEAELLDDSQACDARFGGSDVTNAAIAAELPEWKCDVAYSFA